MFSKSRTCARAPLAWLSRARARAPTPLFGFPLFLLLSSQISVAIAHVTDDPSQIHNDEIILSTVQGVYVWRIDLRTVLINEVRRWKRWLSDNSEQILLFVRSRRC